MDWEIVRLVILTLCQAATGYWAFHVSAGSWLARSLFAAITVVGVGIIVWTGMADEAEKREAAQAQGRLEGKINALQAGQLQGFSRVISGTKEIENFLKTHASEVPAVVPVAQTKPIASVGPLAPPKIPDVAMAFYNPAGPYLRIINESDAIARQIKWSVVVWNVDDTSNLNPLPIPVQTYDYLRPRHSGGNEVPFANSLLSGEVRIGTHLFGCATVECPDCTKGRSYWIYIDYGNSGWYSEIPGGDAQLRVPAEMSHDGILRYEAAMIASVPVSKRIPLGQPPQIP
jgi:hypothetical protein